MTFYLSNPNVHPIGFEPAEFLDVPPESAIDDRPQAPVEDQDPGGPGAEAQPRTYRGSAISIYWSSERCTHAERCVSGAPDVFDRGARPWVRPAAASANEVAAVIDTCPSGALSYTRHDGAPNGRRGRTVDEEPANSTAPDPEWPFYVDEATGPFPRLVSVTITPQVDGPLLVEGPVRLRRSDGSTETAGRLALCRCGRSGSKPNCDGSHVRIGFVAAGVDA